MIICLLASFVFLFLSITCFFIDCPMAGFINFVYSVLFLLGGLII